MGHIFLSYVKEDQPQVLRLYDQLETNGFKPWMAEKNILPGQEWKPAIRDAIQSADIFIACLSSKAINKRGMFQQEVALALDVLQQIPEQSVYFIPLRLEECSVPTRLSHIQWLDFFSNESVELLLKALAMYVGVNIVASRFPIEILKEAKPRSPELSVQYKERGRQEVREWGKKRTAGEWDWYSLGNALEDYLDAIRYDPGHKHPYTNIAYVYHVIGERELAKAFMEQSYALAKPGPDHPGQNHTNVQRAIDQDSTLSGYTLNRPPMPDWFRQKYRGFLTLGPGVQASSENIRRYLGKDENSPSE